MNDSISSENEGDNQSSSKYETSSKAVILLNVVLGIGSMELLFPGTLPKFVLSMPFTATDFISYMESNAMNVLLMILFLASVIAIHEAIHYYTHVFNGFDPEWGFGVLWVWKIPNPYPYVIVLNSEMNRYENISGLIAPFIIINILSAPFLLPVFPDTVNYYAAAALVVNTTGSCSDIYHTIRLSLHPEGTRYENVEQDDEFTTYRIPPNGSILS